MNPAIRDLLKKQAEFRRAAVQVRDCLTEIVGYPKGAAVAKDFLSSVVENVTELPPTLDLKNLEAHPESVWTPTNSECDPTSPIPEY